jgi:hypothetical protein
MDVAKHVYPASALAFLAKAVAVQRVHHAIKTPGSALHVMDRETRAG